MIQEINNNQQVTTQVFQEVAVAMPVTETDTVPSVCNFEEKLKWATTPWENGLATRVLKSKEKTVDQQRKEAQASEKLWGNSMIGQEGNGNWTTLLGENLVMEVLSKLGKNPRKPVKKGGYFPDIETDDAIYEVKTSNWCVGGTAGEKVFGVMYKYSDIPSLYGKPLRIICVAYQEHELTFGNTRIFGEVSENKQAFLDLAKTMGIEYVRFSDLIAPLRVTEVTPKAEILNENTSVDMIE